MSEPLSNEAIDLIQQKKGRIIFLLMALFFVIPIVVVIMMYKLDWRPAGQVHGQLIQPPKTIVMNGDLLTDKQVTANQFWQSKWNMVYVTQDCESQCLSRIHDMRQVYVSMYKDMIRVQRVLITSQHDVASIRAQYPDMLIVNSPEQNVKELINQFEVNNQTVVDGLYFVDPLGNIMMKYSANKEAKWIRKDLVKLLKSSWAG